MVETMRAEAHIGPGGHKQTAVDVEDTAQRSEEPGGPAGDR
jgi:hypothetical protein